MKVVMVAPGPKCPKSVNLLGTCSNRVLHLSFRFPYQALMLKIEYWMISFSIQLTAIFQENRTESGLAKRYKYVYVVKVLFCLAKNFGWNLARVCLAWSVIDAEATAFDKPFYLMVSTIEPPHLLLKFFTSVVTKTSWRNWIFLKCTYSRKWICFVLCPGSVLSDLTITLKNPKCTLVLCLLIAGWIFPWKFWLRRTVTNSEYLVWERSNNRDIFTREGIKREK